MTVPTVFFIMRYNSRCLVRPGNWGGLSTQGNIFPCSSKLYEFVYDLPNNFQSFSEPNEIRLVLKENRNVSIRPVSLRIWKKRIFAFEYTQIPGLQPQLKINKNNWFIYVLYLLFLCVTFVAHGAIRIPVSCYYMEKYFTVLIFFDLF